MDLTIYDIIQGPWVTEKSYKQQNGLNQITLKVHPKANKPMIADALKKLFNVEVEKVRTSIRKGKTRRVGRRITYGKTVKKAIVTLKEGYSVNTGLGAENAAMQHDQISKGI